jgi:hypothetical protein
VTIAGGAEKYRRNRWGKGELQIFPHQGKVGLAVSGGLVARMINNAAATNPVGSIVFPAGRLKRKSWLKLAAV